MQGLVILALPFYAVADMANSTFSLDFTVDTVLY